MSTWGDLITDALIDAGVYSSVEAIPAADFELAARRLNRILDQQAALRRYAYTTQFTQYTLTPNHAPHLIGPNLQSPDLATPLAAPRPVRIESAALILNDVTPNVDVRLHLRDRAWWADQHVKSLSSNVPTDVYYEPDWPNGSLYLWPVPAYAYGLRLEMWTALGQIPLDASGNLNFKASFQAPPGYAELLLAELIEKLCQSYGRPLTPALTERLRRARAAVEAYQSRSPRTASLDYGTRGSSPGGFNYYSGGPA